MIVQGIGVKLFAGVGGCRETAAKRLQLVVQSAAETAIVCACCQYCGSFCRNSYHLTER